MGSGGPSGPPLFFFGLESPGLMGERDCAPSMAKSIKPTDRAAPPIGSEADQIPWLSTALCLGGGHALGGGVRPVARAVLGGRCRRPRRSCARRLAGMGGAQ